MPISTGSGAKYTLAVVAAALAARAAELNGMARICLADLDFFGAGLSKLIGLNSRPGLADVVADHTDLLPRHGTVVVLSPAATGGEVAAYLRGLGHPVTWFILDAATFPPTRRRVDYGPLQAELGAVRCRVHLIRGDRPLNANWGRGAHLADRYA